MTFIGNVERTVFRNCHSKVDAVSDFQFVVCLCQIRVLYPTWAGGYSYSPECPHPSGLKAYLILMQKRTLVHNVPQAYHDKASHFHFQNTEPSTTCNKQCKNKAYGSHVRSRDDAPVLEACGMCARSRLLPNTAGRRNHRESAH